MNATDVVIVGGGVAGLVIAHDLARAGRGVVLCEASDRLGGLLRRGVVAGLDVDLGAESFATRTDAVAVLAAELGLGTVAPRPGGAWIAVQTESGPRRAPLSRRTLLGIPADPLAADVALIIGADAAAQAAHESALPGLGAPALAEPSLYDLVAARLGPLVAARLVDPLCRSVYSRPAAELRLSQVNPALWRAFVERGSLLAAVATVLGERPVVRAGAAVGGIAGGMWRLPEALAASARAHGADLRTSTAVTAVDPTGILVHTTAGTLRARRVVVATGPAAAASLPGCSADRSGGDFTSGGSNPADSSSRVSISSRTALPSRQNGGRIRIAVAAIAHPGLDAFPVGSGVIVDPALQTAAKALTHVNAKWEWAGAETGARGIHLVRLSARDADAGTLATAADIARETSLLTGVPIAPEQVRDLLVHEWADAVARDEQSALPAEPAPPGIEHAGAAAAGTGLACVVPHARTLATRLIDELALETRSIA
ncbi:MAG: FAD-dependent oxidoreductase [Microbacterium sp.]